MPFWLAQNTVKLRVMDTFRAPDDELSDSDYGDPNPVIVPRGFVEALQGNLSDEWGVRYDTHVDWIERPAANEAWARTIYNENKDEGAIAVVRRSVTAWEDVTNG